MADARDVRDRGLARMFKIAAQIRRIAIDNILLQAHAGTVVSGPFAGVRLLPDASWSDGELAPKLLGCYEAEMHPAIAKAAARNPKVVVNIGCAEGS